jgi:hypothetical protein
MVQSVPVALSHDAAPELTLTPTGEVVPLMVLLPLEVVPSVTVVEGSAAIPAGAVRFSTPVEGEVKYSPPPPTTAVIGITVGAANEDVPVGLIDREPV